MTQESRHDNRENKKLSRRRAIQLAAGGSAITLAGCNSGPNSGGNNSSSNSTKANGNSGGQTFVDYTHEVPAQIQFNEYNSQGVNKYTSAAIYAWGANIDGSSLTHIPMLAKNWELKDKTFTIELNDSFTWHNGKSFTAEDYALHFNLDRHMKAGVHYPVWKYAKSVNTTGEYTLEINLDSDVNEDVITSTVFGLRLMKEPDIYRPYLERFKDATSKQKKEKIRKELAKKTIEKPTGAGPLEFVRKNEQRMVLKPYKKFPWEQLQQQFADATEEDISNWPTGLDMSQVNYRFSESYNQAAQYINGDVADGGYIQNIEKKSLPSHFKMINAPSLYGIGINFNFWEKGNPAGDPALRDPNVRKAFAHVIDRKSVGIQYQGKDATTDQVMTGLLDAQENEWLDDGFFDKLNPYKKNNKKAAEYLRKSGYTKKDGKWYRPNGKQFTTTFATAAGISYYVSGFEVAVSNLKEFGIDAQLNTEPNSSFFGSPANKRGAQFTTPGYYGGQDPHPYFAYDFVYRRPVVQPAGSSTPNYNLPGNEKIKVPPVGKPESDKRTTIDPYAKLTKLGKTKEKSSQKKIIKELAWATNWWLPKLTCAEYTNSYVISTDDWDFPSTDSGALNMTFMSPEMQWQFGVVQTKSD